MARSFKQDNYNGNGDYGDMFATVWCAAAVTAANWIAVKVNDQTSPAALEGFSFVTAISTDAGALYDTIGVAVITTTAAQYVQVQIAGYYASANVADAVTIGQNLIISSTSGRADAVGNAATNGAAYRIIGRALTDGSASNLANVNIYPHPMFLN